VPWRQNDPDKENFEGSTMKVFIAATVFAVFAAFVASIVLSGVQMASYTAFTTSGARVGDPGTNLVGPG
jgi:hypothetical protein